MTLGTVFKNVICMVFKMSGALRDSLQSYQIVTGLVGGIWLDRQ